VHLSHAREKTGHAMIGVQQWIPASAPGTQWRR